ncbi:hypothetical protein AFK76_09590 [Idiomarina zobellii]|uniref:Transcription elongation factor GreA/GreB C-terminal domain-containing protein n=2 Tax=Idiomarina zobellii TaxID=86103 RepID=A0A837NC34_9GAMM|nr:hypothetical protein AFK76_09590 [Idiomarina zobellii]MAL82748.1 transcription elongation factor GreAB [Idiomarina sp.]
MRMFRPCKGSVCLGNPIFQNAGQRMLMDPIELSILLERLEFSQKQSSRLLGRITVGSSVTIKNRVTREKLTVTLVPPELAEPEEQMISFISPLGSALLGLKLGDVAVTEFGRRTDKWDVISVNQRKVITDI